MPEPRDRRGPSHRPPTPPAGPPRPEEGPAHLPWSDGEASGRAHRPEGEASGRPSRSARGEAAARASRRDGALTTEDPEAKARGICLNMLTAAPRTRAQLARALERRGIDPEVADSVLGRFSEAGLIDDAAFAGAWVDSRHAGRGLGRRALAAELRSRGVDDDIVRDAVDDITPGQEEDTARRLARRKLDSTRGHAPEVRVRRALGMLARKGYAAGLAYRVVREELEAEGAELDLPDPGLD
ncbi:regulatory protein RecX [Nocardiopsis sediminis]|uniref:Regulatory protein RecX n=1 Tax=Nocardiopsis sediminis TaxID=1778267 RepID=A0ABV8FKK8_9ACTN